MAAELGRVDAMLGSFVASDENHGNIVAVESREFRVLVDVDLAKDGVELREQRGNHEFGVFTKMTAVARIKSDFERMRRHGLG